MSSSNDNSFENILDRGFRSLNAKAGDEDMDTSSSSEMDGMTKDSFASPSISDKSEIPTPSPRLDVTWTKTEERLLTNISACLWLPTILKLNLNLICYSEAGTKLIQSFADLGKWNNQDRFLELSQKIIDQEEGDPMFQKPSKPKTPASPPISDLQKQQFLKHTSDTLSKLSSFTESSLQFFIPSDDQIERNGQVHEIKKFREEYKSIHIQYGELKNKRLALAVEIQTRIKQGCLLWAVQICSTLFGYAIGSTHIFISGVMDYFNNAKTVEYADFWLNSYDDEVYGFSTEELARWLQEHYPKWYNDPSRRDMVKLFSDWHRSVMTQHATLEINYAKKMRHFAKEGFIGDALSFDASKRDPIADYDEKMRLNQNGIWEYQMGAMMHVFYATNRLRQALIRYIDTEKNNLDFVKSDCYKFIKEMYDRTIGLENGQSNLVGEYLNAPHISGTELNPTLVELLSWHDKLTENEKREIVISSTSSILSTMAGSPDTPDIFIGLAEGILKESSANNGISLQDWMSQLNRRVDINASLALCSIPHLPALTDALVARRKMIDRTVIQEESQFLRSCLLRSNHIKMMFPKIKSVSEMMDDDDAPEDDNPISKFSRRIIYDLGVLPTPAIDENAISEDADRDLEFDKIISLSGQTDGLIYSHFCLNGMSMGGDPLASTGHLASCIDNRRRDKDIGKYAKDKILPVFERLSETLKQESIANLIELRREIEFATSADAFTRARITGIMACQHRRVPSSCMNLPYETQQLIFNSKSMMKCLNFIKIEIQLVGLLNYALYHYDELQGGDDSRGDTETFVKKVTSLGTSIIVNNNNDNIGSDIISFSSVGLVDAPEIEVSTEFEKKILALANDFLSVLGFNSPQTDALTQYVIDIDKSSKDIVLDRNLYLCLSRFRSVVGTQQLEAIGTLPEGYLFAAVNNFTGTKRGVSVDFAVSELLRLLSIYRYYTNPKNETYKQNLLVAYSKMEHYRLGWALSFTDIWKSWTGTTCITKLSTLTLHPEAGIMMNALVSICMDESGVGNWTDGYMKKWAGLQNNENHVKIEEINSKQYSNGKQQVETFLKDKKTPDLFVAGGEGGGKKSVYFNADDTMGQFLGEMKDKASTYSNLNVTVAKNEFYAAQKSGQKTLFQYLQESWDKSGKTSNDLNSAWFTSTVDSAPPEIKTQFLDILEKASTHTYHSPGNTGVGGGGGDPPSPYFMTMDQIKSALQNTLKSQDNVSPLMEKIKPIYGGAGGGNLLFVKEGSVPHVEVGTINDVGRMEQEGYNVVQLLSSDTTVRTASTIKDVLAQLDDYACGKASSLRHINVMDPKDTSVMGKLANMALSQAFTASRWISGGFIEQALPAKLFALVMTYVLVRAVNTFSRPTIRSQFLPFMAAPQRLPGMGEQNPFVKTVTWNSVTATCSSIKNHILNQFYGNALLGLVVHSGLPISTSELYNMYSIMIVGLFVIKLFIFLLKPSIHKAYDGFMETRIKIKAANVISTLSENSWVKRLANPFLPYTVQDTIEQKKIISIFNTPDG